MRKGELILPGYYDGYRESDDSRYPNDIGLLLLEHNVTLSNHVGPICLSRPDQGNLLNLAQTVAPAQLFVAGDTSLVFSCTGSSIPLPTGSVTTTLECGYKE